MTAWKAVPFVKWAGGKRTFDRPGATDLVPGSIRQLGSRARHRGEAASQLGRRGEQPYLTLRRAAGRLLQYRLERVR